MIKRSVITIDQAIKEKKEFQQLEFKRKLDLNDDHDRLEIIKDIVAIANSGGGIILIGKEDDGTPSSQDITSALSIDPARITDQIYRYTNEQFDNFKIHVLNNDHNYIAIEIFKATSLLIFTLPGIYTYQEREKCAFAQGTLYIRHSAKSEPANSQDIKKWIEQEIEKVKESITKKIIKVVESPDDSDVLIIPTGDSLSPIISDRETSIKKETTIIAPVKSYDDSHPYRRTELVDEINRRLEGEIKITGFNIHTIRKVLGIENKKRYFHIPKYGSPQYSEEFTDFIIDQYKQDNAFFDKIYSEFRKLNR